MMYLNIGNGAGLDPVIFSYYNYLQCKGDFKNQFTGF